MLFVRFRPVFGGCLQKQSRSFQATLLQRGTQLTQLLRGTRQRGPSVDIKPCRKVQCRRSLCSWSLCGLLGEAATGGAEDADALQQLPAPFEAWGAKPILAAKEALEERLPELAQVQGLEAALQLLTVADLQECCLGLGVLGGHPFG